MENNSEYKRPRTRRKRVDLTSCQDCGVFLSDDNWSKSNQEYGRYTCKTCWNARQKKYDKQTLAQKRQKSVERKEKWDDDRKKLEVDKSYARWLKNKYGITYDEYNEMLIQQDYSCKICQTKDPGGRGRFHVDHCHEEGHVRGFYVLCAI